VGSRLPASCPLTAREILDWLGWRQIKAWCGTRRLLRQVLASLFEQLRESLRIDQNSHWPRPS
jgi:hypothetical protein